MLENNSDGKIHAWKVSVWKLAQWRPMVVLTNVYQTGLSKLHITVNAFLLHLYVCIIEFCFHIILTKYVNWMFSSYHPYETCELNVFFISSLRNMWIECFLHIILTKHVNWMFSSYHPYETCVIQYWESLGARHFDTYMIIKYQTLRRDFQYGGGHITLLSVVVAYQPPATSVV